jgi:DNA-directed RNA polymerase specialized sigma24 family protein
MRAVSRADDLDFLLHAWLCEEDQKQAELKFSRYFRLAFAELSRYVRSLGADPSTAQDIVQQSLIKLFDHLGVARPRASERMRAATAGIKPLKLGAMHVRLVQGWVRDLITFRDAALAFEIAKGEEASRWRPRRDEINARIDPLTRQGVRFIEDLRSRFEASIATLMEDQRESRASARNPGHQYLDHVPGEIADEALRLFVDVFLGHAERVDAVAFERSLGCDGAVGFVRHTSTACDYLATLAIPSNGLLYTIVKRQFLDSLKVKRREVSESVPDLWDSEAPSILDELDLGAEGTTDLAPDAAFHAADPASEVLGLDRCVGEIESRYRAFLELLRAPLTRAEGELAKAVARGRMKDEQARVDSLRIKYDRLMAVLAALREIPQPTENEIAERLGLTRNQIKYAIERIRQEFMFFFPDLARDAEQRRKSQGAD